MNADLQLGKMPSTRVRRRIFLLGRSIALFVRMRRQCSRGISQYVSVSARPLRIIFAASLSLIDSSSAATDSASAFAASRDSMARIALSTVAIWERLDW